MGGKGGGSEIPMMPAQDNTAMMTMMMQMMQQSMANQMAMMQEQMQPPEMAPMPEIDSPEPVDWKAKQDEIKTKMTADYETENQRRHGVMDTIHTSPLLDEELLLSLDDEEDENPSILTNNVA
jgi:hypothetical protein